MTKGITGALSQVTDQRAVLGLMFRPHSTRLTGPRRWAELARPALPPQEKQKGPRWRLKPASCGAYEEAHEHPAHLDRVLRGAQFGRAENLNRAGIARDFYRADRRRGVRTFMIARPELQNSCARKTEVVNWAGSHPLFFPQEPGQEPEQETHT
jgi:hypothetical protein